MVKGEQRSLVKAALGLFMAVILVGGCAAARTNTKHMVVSEYVLEKAGFKKLDVNFDTPRRHALQLSIPKGQITTFEKGGKDYYVYNDPNHDALYIGDATAYKNYLSLAHGQNVCQKVKGTDNSQFWSCFQEYEQRHHQGLER
jgi:hypothetical protein